MDSLTKQFKSLSVDKKEIMLTSIVSSLGKMDVSKGKQQSKKLDDITSLFSHMIVNSKKTADTKSDVDDLMNSIVRLNMLPSHERPKKLKQIGKKIIKLRAKGRKWKNTSPKKSLSKNQEEDIFAMMGREKRRMGM